jgi:hypothetical protein
MNERPRAEWTLRRVGLLLLVIAAAALSVVSFVVDVPDEAITLPFTAGVLGWIAYDYRQDPSPLNRRFLLFGVAGAVLLIVAGVLELAGV